MSTDAQIHSLILRTFLTSTFRMIDAEHASLIDSVGRLEPRTRDTLINQYGEEHAWRGLASDDFIRAFEAKAALEFYHSPSVTINGSVRAHANV